MAPLDDPNSTCYEEFRYQREVFIYVNTYELENIVVAVKKEPSWPQGRKDKRKNFNLKQ